LFQDQPFPYPVEILEVIESTQTYLKKKVEEESLPDGYTVVALHQVEGRGRFHRRWWSGKGSLPFSFWVSFSEDLSSEKLFLLPLLSATALVETIRSLVDFPSPPVGIKYPNDILYPDGKKVAGILLEGVLKGGRFTGGVLGVGVNLYEGEVPPSPFKERIGFLSRIVPEDFLKREDFPLLFVGRFLEIFFRFFSSWEKGEDDYLSSYHTYLLPSFRLVRVREKNPATGNEEVGYIENIDRRGVVTIRTKDGRTVSVPFPYLEGEDLPFPLENL
jgi:BirA family biotin operon repressor/biotin-[acetyl-CoA-carboxylase] ligase